MNEAGHVSQVTYATKPSASLIFSKLELKALDSVGVYKKQMIIAILKIYKKFGMWYDIKRISKRSRKELKHLLCKARMLVK